MSAKAPPFTAIESDAIIARYRAGESMQKIARSLHTAEHHIKRLMYDHSIIECDLCINGCDDIEFAHGICLRCYQAAYRRKKLSKSKEPIAELVKQSPDRSVAIMYRTGISMNKISELLKLPDYKVKQALIDSGALKARRCINPGCENVAYSRGLCKKCYNRYYRENIASCQSKNISMEIQTLQTELKRNKTLYGCYTMAVPLHVRVDKHNEIVWLETEIKKLEAAEQN